MTNEKALSFLGNPKSQITGMIQDLSQNEYSNKKTYYKYSLKDNDYGIFKVQNKKIIWKDNLKTVSSKYKQNIISRPWHIRKVDDLLWVSSLYKPLALFDLNFSFKGYFGEYGDFSDQNPNRYIYSKGFSVSSSTVFIAHQWRHRVSAHDRETGELKWIFGSGEVGLPDAGKLSNPTDIAILPSGNILVSCWDMNIEGKGAGAIVELDKDNGSFVKIHLSYKRNGDPWNGDVHCPSSIKIIKNKNNNFELWISYYYKNCIGIFSYDETLNTFSYKKILGKTANLEIGDIYIQNFCIDDNYEKVFLLANGPKVIACLDIETNDLIAFVGRSIWEDYSSNPNTLGGFFNPSGIEIVGDSIYVCDYANNRIQQFDISLFNSTKYIDIEYEGEDHSFNKRSIDYISNESFDYNNKTLRISINKISCTKIDPEIIVCESI